ncbi:MAG: DUF1499 domain-containing protein [Pseudomonadota bacterium]
MRPLPPRLPSASARWALRLAKFLPFLGVAVFVSVQLQLIDRDGYVLLYWVVLWAAIVALFLTLIGMRSLWVRGTKGGRKVSGALFLCTVVLVPYIAMGADYLRYPRQADTSTDLIVPPLFLDELRDIAGDARAIVASTLRDGYPELSGQRYQADFVRVYDATKQVMEENGLSERVQRGRIGANDDIFIEYDWNTFFALWPHELVVRLTDEGETVFVDMRSRAIEKDHDLAKNAKLIARLQARLDALLIGEITQ